MTFPMTVVDTIIRAVSSAIPDRVAAGHHADLVFLTFHGINPIDGSFFLGFVGPTGGGWGAKATEDGMNGVVCSNDGDTHNSPCEQIEVKYPVLIERHALRQDSGGAGRHRGGLGIEVAIRALTPITVTCLTDRMHCAPWGLQGGQSALGNLVVLERAGQSEPERRNSKIQHEQLKAGDRIILRSGGGGGYGSPLEREPEQVERDVRQGYVTKDSAEKHYGIVFRDGTLEADIVRTQARREEMRKQGLPVNDPENPDAPGERWSRNLNRRRPPDTRQLSDEERLVIAMSGGVASEPKSGKKITIR